MSFAPNFPPFSDACSVLASRVVWKSFHDSQDETVSLLKREQQCEEHFGKDNGNASCILLLEQKIVRGPTAKQGRRQNRERCNSRWYVTPNSDGLLPLPQSLVFHLEV